MTRGEIHNSVETMVKELYHQEDGASIAENFPVLGQDGVLDSVLALQLLLKIEERFAIVVSDDEIERENLASLASITRFIENKLRKN
jgi:acyl carrier protein